MEKSVFYNTKNIPVKERESFNNTILLLTLIKSQYYYIIGFSRPEHIIKIGFDYESKIYGNIFEVLEIDFCSSDKYVIMRANLQNASVGQKYNGEKIYKKGDETIYEYHLPKDKVLPIGVYEMNEYIMEAKRDIGEFLFMREEDGYDN